MPRLCWGCPSHPLLPVLHCSACLQGFASGDPVKDTLALRQFAKDGHEFAVAQSFSKNFGRLQHRSAGWGWTNTRPCARCFQWRWLTCVWLWFVFLSVPALLCRPVRSESFVAHERTKRCDLRMLRLLVAPTHSRLVAFFPCFSFQQRVGCLSLVTQSAAERSNVESQLKIIARAMYSNPPIHGARIVTTVLGDAALRKQWEGDVKEMADRIIRMRVELRAALEKLGSKHNWSAAHR